MWINTNRDLLLSALDALRRVNQDSLAADLQRDMDNVSPQPDDRAFIDAAREMYVSRHGDVDVEVDDDAVLSRSDAGAFVQGWLWVSYEEIE
jgi:hypothetical protein